MTIEIPPDLLEQISKGRASLFLGAGASCEAGFPGSNDIAKFLADATGAAHKEYLENQNLSTVADYLYLDKKNFGPQWVRQKIIEFIENHQRHVKRPPSRAHELMTKIKWRTIFTTNYDRLVEISYDSSAESVQRLLPIYYPDTQIWRREEEVVKLIKLNGSTDEAQRKCSHELVVNFSDQTIARHSNKDFYDLLRQEAVNGPIIFVGFSFSHPGATEPASSPEFLLLQDLLRDMGPAARSHYCVTNLDLSKISSKLLVKKLEGSLVQVINANFGEFLEAVLIHMKTPAPLAKRPAVSLQVGTTTIKIDYDDYIKDKRHFEIIGSHLQEAEPPSVAESLNGFENWSTFFDKKIIERTCKKDLLRKLQVSIDSAPSILSVVTSPGWGKTFLLRDISVDLSLKKRPVFWLNPYSVMETKGDSTTSSIVGGWDNKRIDSLIGLINKTDDQALDSDFVPVIICDNCPQRIEEVLTLFRHLISNNRHFVLVISFRNQEFEFLYDSNPILKKTKIFRPEGSYNSQDEIRYLIDFCAKNDVGSINMSQEFIANRIFEDDASSSIILALQIIFDKRHRPFSEIVKGLWEKVHGNETATKLVLRVASLHRYGSVFYPRLYTLVNTFPAQKQNEAWRAYQDCMKKSILFEEVEEDEPLVRTLHSLVAEKLAQVSGKSPAEIDDELLLISKALVSRNDIDLDLSRQVLKQINDYNISLSSEEKVDQLFRIIADSTNGDWVVCQQFSKYLLGKGDFEASYVWAVRALERNQHNSALQHHKGHILSRWGKFLMETNKADEAQQKFIAARECFSLSRSTIIPSEYGYVTHLDMLIYLINNSKDENEKSNLIAEGAQLYTESIRKVPEDVYNFLLDERFFIFDLKGNKVTQLCEKIEEAIDNGTSSPYGAAFIADRLYERLGYSRAIEVLEKQRAISDESVLVLVKEAEINAREGNFSQAAKILHSAKMKERDAENVEVKWGLAYWDLITAFALEDFQRAHSASGKLAAIDFRKRDTLPRGYIWKESAKSVKRMDRKFVDHAKIWSGYVQNLRIGGQYGRIEMKNQAGETFEMSFNPRYFHRRDFRAGDFIKFVVAILSGGLRAESVQSHPFINTIDDVFVKT
ncbi:MAG: SIR2 family protein [Candidatus Bathyarchaeota archaeon]|nr:SIR2 family protein [Candidatus Bathyarchaeota archaeon]